MLLQGVVTASAAAELAADLALTTLGVLVVGFLVLEVLYLVASALYLGRVWDRRGVPGVRKAPSPAIDSESDDVLNAQVVGRSRS